METGFVPWPSHWSIYHNGTNQPCDMAVGPCACGAHHELGEFQMKKDGCLYRNGDRLYLIPRNQYFPPSTSAMPGFD